MPQTVSPLKKDFVLVVDDEPHIRNLLGDALRTKGYQVLFAQNGKEGFEKFQKYLPAILITDLMMPVMDGFSLVEKIRATEWGSEVFIIAMSAVYRDFKLKEKTIFDFEVEYLIKPFSLLDLLKLLRKSKTWKRKKQTLAQEGDPGRGAREIRGQLDHFSFPILLVNLFSERKTGVLHLKAGKRAIKIYLQSGMPVFAQGREFNVDREAVVSIIMDVFHWKEGEFYFEALKQIPPEIPRHTYELYQLIYEGARKHYSLEILIEEFKKFQNAVVIRKPGFEAKVGLVGFSEKELAVVKEIDNNKTVDELVVLGRDQIQNIFQILWILKFMEVISFEKSG